MQNKPEANTKPQENTENETPEERNARILDGVKKVWDGVAKNVKEHPEEATRVPY